MLHTTISYRLKEQHILWHLRAADTPFTTTDNESHFVQYSYVRIYEYTNRVTTDMNWLSILCCLMTSGMYSHPETLTALLVYNFFFFFFFVARSILPSWFRCYVYLFALCNGNRRMWNDLRVFCLCVDTLCHCE